MFGDSLQKVYISQELLTLTSNIQVMSEFFHILTQCRESARKLDKLFTIHILAKQKSNVKESNKNLKYPK